MRVITLWAHGQSSVTVSCKSLGFYRPRTLLACLQSSLLEFVNAQARLSRERRVRVLDQHFVVVNKGPVPALALFVELCDLEIAVRLLGFQRSDDLLRLGYALVVRIKGHKIRECRDGLAC